MAVAANICVAWPSTVGSIPAGWTRETSLDSRYVLGAATGADADLSTDRGSTTHTHSSPSHTPTQNAHTHTISSPGNDVTSTIVSGVVGGGGVASDGVHGHDNFSSASTTATNQGVAITVDAADNELSFISVIWIKSDGTPLALPANCLAFFASDSLPSGWSRVHGDRYLKGASGGGNGGSTGGSNTHTHTSPAHTHPQNVHSHSAVTSSVGNLALPERGTGGDAPSSTAHTHSVSLDASTATNQPVTTTIDSASSEPPFTKLNIVTSGSDSLPDSIVAIWLGTNAGIPSDWSRLTAMDGRWLKGAAANGQSGVDTGGGTQHSHTAADCQPTQDAHSHTVAAGGATGTIAAQAGAHNTFAANGHNHTAWTATNETATNSAVSVTIDQCSADAALPKHRTVIYIQFSGSTPAPRPVTTTSYDIGRFDTGDPHADLLPEVAKRIAQGDLRYIPRVFP